MSEFIYRLQLIRPELLDTGPTFEEAAILEDHGQYLSALTEQDTVVLAGRTQDAGPETFGIVILKANSEDEALAIMQQDPAVKHGVMTAQLWSFKTAFSSPSNKHRSQA